MVLYYYTPFNCSISEHDELEAPDTVDGSVTHDDDLHPWPAAWPVILKKGCLMENIDLLASESIELLIMDKTKRWFAITNISTNYYL